MTAPKPAHIRQAEMLARGFAADVARAKAVTAEIVRSLGEQKQPDSVGAHGRVTLAQMAREVGMHDSAPGDLGAVVRLADGRAYR